MHYQVFKCAEQSIFNRVRECQSFFCAVFLFTSVNADIFLYRFVLRSYIAQRAIEAAENGDFSVVSNLQKVGAKRAFDTCRNRLLWEGKRVGGEWGGGGA